MTKVHTESGIRVDKDVSIYGFGSDKTLIQAAESSELAQDRVFWIEKGVKFKMKSLTIRHGRVTDVPRSGGGIQNQGDLYIENCVITDTRATFGVGIENKGNLVLKNSVISKNIGVPRPSEEDKFGRGCHGTGAGIKTEADLKSLDVSGEDAKERVTISLKEEHLEI